MAFLDNSGDIILDAVLTDTGRLALAKGNGSFKISQFVFADDEINYGLYNKNHPSGSAYYDLDILQTPILEAFTNNASTVKYPLLTNQRTDLLFLPSLLINNKDAIKPFFSNYNLYLVTADSVTYDYVVNSSTAIRSTLNGTQPSNLSPIRLDQGLNSTATDKTKLLSTTQNDLYESQYIITMDNSLIELADVNGNPATPSYTDDDNFSSYLVGGDTDLNFVQEMQPATSTSTDASLDNQTVILGTRGSKVQFKLKTTTQLQTSTYLFTKLGGETDTAFATAVGTSATGHIFYYIDTYIKVLGVKTGVSNNVPIRIIKFKS